MFRIAKQLAAAVAVIGAWEAGRLAKHEIKRTLKKREKRRVKREEKEEQNRYPDTWGFSGGQPAKGVDFPEVDYASS